MITLVRVDSLRDNLSPERWQIKIEREIKMNEVFLIDKNTGKTFACFKIGLENFPTDKEFRLKYCEEVYNGYTHSSLAFGYNSVEIKGDEFHIYKIRKSMTYIDCYVFQRVEKSNKFMYSHSNGKSLIQENIDSSKERT